MNNVVTKTFSLTLMHIFIQYQYSPVDQGADLQITKPSQNLFRISDFGRFYYKNDCQFAPRRRYWVLRFSHYIMNLLPALQSGNIVWEQIHHYSTTPKDVNGPAEGRYYSGALVSSIIPELTVLIYTGESWLRQETQ